MPLDAKLITIEGLANTFPETRYVAHAIHSFNPKIRISLTVEIKS